MKDRKPRNYLDLPLGLRAPEEINVVVEIPEKSRNKYEYDKELDIFRLDRVLHSAIHYPGDYGFAPQTLALDDDPLDVLVLTIEPTFPGCLVAARPIGLLEMFDQGKEDDKVLAVPVGERVERRRHRLATATGGDHRDGQRDGEGGEEGLHGLSSGATR